ncbi:bifunctional tetrahydrofolate synthase/dihydrofolate synthase [Candidatus Erwinia haradaeae]|uniref:Dihydrofolate synthase/folylpolyglutamate synthase n=1 Tax=Candidatus Erwinia haradaeae TaxID=1922217 RepID=A0A451D9X4_9GAMM|nr:bifunctional tetrahydrofolate synthase/dihydrofolate synthase [Candidatus Erwinia haradaeae]VFP83128.1 Dihydrofolate synthase/folylpolyglutamate synthase [Candidatus Erwinia haradaeae]
MKNSPQATSPLNTWSHYLEYLHAQPIDLELTRVTNVATSLNLLRPAPIIFTVAGTNGKGTTCRAIEMILLAAGYRVGVYTSPHLMYYSERVRICGKELEDLEHTKAFSVINIARSTTSLTYFEFGTLAALWLFKQAKLDIVILEVGLGGRLDATNIIDSDVAIITTIGRDHTDFLGVDYNSIGREKAGIFRKGKPAVVGEPNMPATIREVAKQKKARLYQYNRDWFYSVVGNYWVFKDQKGSIGYFPLPQIPIDNAATALAAIRMSSIQVNPIIIQRILHLVTLPGRFQTIAHAPQVILDVAHNPHAAQYLARKLIEIKKTSHIHAIVGMLRDKDVSETLSYLIPHVDYWYCATLTHPRGSSALYLMSFLKKATCFSSVAQAWRCAIAKAKKTDIILVFGSFHTVSEVIRSQTDKHKKIK